MSEQIKKGVSPKFFFLSLGVIVSLITVVSTSLSLFFETLNNKMPDVLNSIYQYGYSSYTYDNMRTMMATLIIFFPVFLIISYFWRKTIKGGLEGGSATLFRWMMYVILFLASVVIIVDLVTLVNYFVSGEITNRFVYKVLGVALIAVIVWAYYYISLKNFTASTHKNKTIKTLLFVLSILIFLTLTVFGFMVMGSPKMQRAWRLDERRINDLQSIQWSVINYWQQKETLPQTLNDLKDPISYTSIPVDPEFETGKSYEYIPKDGLSFTLCATFSEDAPKGFIETNPSRQAVFSEGSSMDSVAYPGSGLNASWDYTKGRTCFDRTIDPQIYKPIKKQ